MAACAFTFTPTQGNKQLTSSRTGSARESKQRSTSKSKCCIKNKPWTEEENDALMTFVQSIGTEKHYKWGECSNYLKNLNISRTALSCNRQYNQICRGKVEDSDVAAIMKTRSIEVQTEVTFPPSEEVTWTSTIRKPTNCAGTKVFCPSTTLLKLQGFLLENTKSRVRQLPAMPLFSLTPVNNSSVTEKDASALSQQPEPISCTEAPIMEEEDQLSTEECNPMTDHTYGKDQQPERVLGEPEVSDLTSKLKRAMEEGPVCPNNKKVLRLDKTSSPSTQTYAAVTEKKMFRLDKISSPNTNPVESAYDSPSLANLKYNLRVCSRYINLEYNMMRALLSAGINLKTLVDLEEGFLELASYPMCCDGTFYLSVFQIEGQVYMRYIESGRYRGSFASVRDLLSATLPACTEGAVWSQVYNEEDVYHQLELKSKKNNMTLRPDMAYRRNLSDKKSSIKNCIPTLLGNLKGKEDDCGLLGMILHTKYSCHQRVIKEDMRDRWYIQCSGSFQPCMPQLQEFFQHYPVCSPPSEKRDSSFLLQNRLPEATSLQDQCDAVSLIPNYPKSKPRSFKLANKVSVMNKCPFSSRGMIIWARDCPKRGKYLQATCIELCSKTTKAAVEDVVMDELPHQMYHHEPHQVNPDESPSSGQSFGKPIPDAMLSALQNEKQHAAANIDTTIVYIEYPA